ncbi:MAG: glycosyltransferase family 2 protein [Myxococcota bacterium]
MTRPVLSLVFPAWNEAENLPALLESAIAIGTELGVGFEIVIVDDGSADASRAVIADWCRRDARVRAVHFEQNQGYGAALRAGLKTARGEFVFFSDADLQFDLAEIRRLLDHTDAYEIVAGYRAPRRDPWLRRVIARAWGMLVRGLFDLPVRDIDCAFKVFHRSVLEAIPIQSVGAFVNTEILVRARAAGFRIKQVPVSHRRRRSGRQSGAHPRVIARALFELVKLQATLGPDRAPAWRTPRPRAAGPIPTATHAPNLAAPQAASRGAAHPMAHPAFRPAADGPAWRAAARATAPSIARSEHPVAANRARPRREASSRS